MNPKNQKIKYKYAIDKSGNLICIDEVSEENRKSRQYYCLSCGKELIPRLGEKNTRHFAHKISDEASLCNKESYLHLLGKKLIKSKFDYSESFKISFRKFCHCHHASHCSTFDSDNCKATYPAIIDLKKYYKVCECEKKVGDYIADALLSNADSDIPVILFEIKYSHACTQSKINSGFQIIEITIDSEDDLIEILNKDLEESPTVAFYGFDKDGKDYLLKYGQQQIQQTFYHSEEYNITFKQRINCHKYSECSLYEKENCTGSVMKTYNIKRWYDSCDVNGSDNNLFSLNFHNKNNPNTNPLYIDLCCTQKCLLETIPTKERTIRICFDYLKRLDNIINDIRERKGIVQFVNFQDVIKNELSSEIERCDMQIFSLFSSGNAHINWSHDDVSCKVIERFRNEKSIFQIAFANETYNRDAVYRICYIIALKFGIAFKACSICKYRREPAEKYLILGSNFCCMSKNFGTSAYPKSEEANKCGYYSVNKELVEKVEKILETFKYKMLK